MDMYDALWQILFLFHFLKISHSWVETCRLKENKNPTVGDAKEREFAGNL